MINRFHHVISFHLHNVNIVIPIRGIFFFFLTNGKLKTQMLRELLCARGCITIKARTRSRAQVSEQSGPAFTSPQGPARGDTAWVFWATEVSLEGVGSKEYKLAIILCSTPAPAVSLLQSPPTTSQPQNHFSTLLFKDRNGGNSCGSK